jgi:hypothetical protein
MTAKKPGPARGSKKPVRPAGEPIEPWSEWLRLRNPRLPYAEWKAANWPQKAPVGHTARPEPTPPDTTPRVVPARRDPAPPEVSYSVPMDDLDDWEREIGNGAGLQGIPPEELLRRSEAAALRSELNHLRAENARKERYGRNVLLGLSAIAVLVLVAYAFGAFG